MDYGVAVDRPIRRSSFTVYPTSKLSKPELARRRQHSLRFVNPPKQKSLYLNTLSSSSLLKLRLPRGLSSDFRSERIRVSSNDAQFGSFTEEEEKKKNEVVQAPSFAEFITSERVKVVAMLALALALCNADRVVMSVAIVPLSLSHGWSRSFSGIVQVGFAAL